MDIYIKLNSKVSLYEKGTVTIADVAEVIAPMEFASKIKKASLLHVDTTVKKKQNFLVSVTDVIKVVQKIVPDATVSSIGETDTWVQYLANKPKTSNAFKWIKTAFVSLVLFVGSSTAIMSFHADGEIPQVFKRYYSLFFGVENANPLIIAIPYAVGIAIGIVGFYNHAFGKKLTDDPTPIEVELELYDKDVTDTMIDALNQRKDNNA